jgi:hypothetical protein
MVTIWRVVGALLASVVLLLGAFVVGGGRYEVRAAGSFGMVRMDRWTGETMVCVPQRCVKYPTSHPDDKPPADVTLP